MRKAKIPSAMRREARRRAGEQCEYCYAPDSSSPSPFNVEHIQPESDGGATALENLAWSCGGCNNHKATKQTASDPESGETAPLFHPRQQAWRDHFRWSADFQSVIGITATGRATVGALRLNRPPLQNLRRMLYLTGNHPAQQSEIEE